MPNEIKVCPYYWQRDSLQKRVSLGATVRLLSHNLNAVGLKLRNSLFAHGGKATRI